MASDIEILNRGINYLLEKMCVIETERFISVTNRGNILWIAIWHYAANH